MLLTAAARKGRMLDGTVIIGWHSHNGYELQHTKVKTVNRFRPAQGLTV